MDIFTKTWMFYQYQQDQIEKMELAKNQAHLIGYFINPEMAKQLSDNNGGSNFETDDETFENTLKDIRDGVGKVNKEEKKRRRRKLKG